MPFKFGELWYGDKLLKRGFAKLEEGGVIMDVVSAEDAVIAEDAGAIAVMALERVPADIRAEGGVARMADPSKILEIMDAVKIPVMAKCRIGHFAEAEVLQALKVAMIDESEVLTPADPFFHVDKKKFKTPFVCGCRNLGEAVRRIWEGAVMIRTKGEAGTGNIIEAVRHQRSVVEAITRVVDADEEEMDKVAKHFLGGYLRALEGIKESQSYIFGTRFKDYLIFGKYTIDEVTEGLLKVLKEIKKLKRLPTPNLAAGGIATPADAALMMKLGSDGVFVGSGIFKSQNPKARAKAIVEAVRNFNDPHIVAEVSKGLGEAMKGVDITQIPR